ncbi:MAG: TerC family protein [Dokdonella sp.]|jgi:predicted tellurium resistance membrane protein TerC|uniref:TerC family protein n=1 Tax=Dokdonella sp. TaxID=2291710 RepID=UPI001B4C007A|nr:TerC family protein [Dokdonella sp.]MCC6440948.1 TerC family protein [Rhodanobacteraceae bacterium]MBK8124488.1 TerC family protein [Dokdonella sp.]MBP6326437.1 TerC family protein [Dokdonella sp.]MBP6329120.1 TerC family protein [Dokdonella sp.]HNV08151.1 TerC family protein [Dokdonella sp.]
MLELLLDPQFWVALFTLATLEIVLGVDNLVFVSIAVSRLAPEQRPLARKIGLGLACITRIALLLVLSFLAGLDDEKLGLFELADQVISLRDLILIGGGLFLLVKAVMEIHNELEGFASPNAEGHVFASFTVVILQIAVIDIVFSLDSVITAIGMVNQVVVMVLAIILAVAVMIFASNPVGDFIDRHPTLRMLALAFLILVGVVLIADGLEFHVPRGYVYFAMGFSIVVEMLNLMARRKASRGT